MSVKYEPNMYVINFLNLYLKCEKNIIETARETFIWENGWEFKKYWLKF